MGLVADYMVGRSEILECGTINFSLGLHAEFSVREVNSRDGIKDQTLPTQRPAAILCGLSLD